MEWPSGARAFIAAEAGSVGPELLVEGRLLPGEAYTVWRIRLPDEEEDAS